MKLYEKLTQARKAAGLTQADVAARLDVSRQAVSRWESGQSKPSTEKLLELANIYDVSLDWLCNEAADGNLYEAVKSAEDDGTNNATANAAGAENKKKRKLRYIAIALTVGVIALACIWFAARPENGDVPSIQFEDMKNENVDMPDQGVNGFDFEWKD